MRGNVEYDSNIEKAIEEITALLRADYGIAKRALALLLIQGDSRIRANVRAKEPAADKPIAAVVERLSALYHEPLSYVVALRRQQDAVRILSGALTHAPVRGLSWRERLSRAMINPLTGLPILFLILYYGLYKLVGEFGAGVASGTMAMVSAIGGPPIALLYRNDMGPTVRANLGLVFAMGLCITISVRALAGEVSWDEVLIGGALLPAVWLGLRASGHLIPRVEGSRLRNAIVIIASAAALLLLWRGLVSW